MVLILCLTSLPAVSLADDKTGFQAERLKNNPLLVVSNAPGLEENINGPSVIRVPDWVDNPLGRYYLYFAHHQGKYIRLAYSDAPEGPFTVYEPGSLRLEESGFPTDPPTPESLLPRFQQTVEAGKPIPLYMHIASPDVHVVPETREIRMYYHGQHDDGRQLTRVAVSNDGIAFKARPELLGHPYFRVFRYLDRWYALGMPGVFYRSEDGLSNFEAGPILFDRNMRHSALLLEDDTLNVFYTNAGDTPESILQTTIDLSGDWMEWTETESTLLLRPEEDWEGGNLPLEPSARGAIKERVNQLRDPAIFEENGSIYLYYSIAGESGVGVAKLSR